MCKNAVRYHCNIKLRSIRDSVYKFGILLMKRGEGSEQFLSAGRGIGSPRPDFNVYYHHRVCQKKRKKAKVRRIPCTM